MTLPSPIVRYIVSPEPGDRARLVEVLGRLLLDQRRRERELAKADTARLAGDQGDGGPAK